MKRCHEIVMKNPESQILSTNKKKKIMQIEEILGSDPLSHVEVLATIVKKAYKCPIKRKLLEDKQIIIHEANTPTQNPEVSMPGSASVSKTFRKIALLRSKKKNQQAKELCNELKSDFKTVKQIATVTKENVRFVYRLLSLPKKRVQAEYIKKLTDDHKKEVIEMYGSDAFTYSLPDVKEAGLRFMSMMVQQAYHTHYLVHSKMDRKMCLASFSSLKPDNVHTVKQMPLHGCKCEQCLNLGLLHEKLTGIGFKGIPKNHACLIEATWCPFRNITQCIKSNKKCKLPTIVETCHDENPENKYEIKNEKNDGNEKCHKILKKGHEIDEINHHCTKFHSFEKK